jgi:hypothetical protein
VTPVTAALLLALAGCASTVTPTDRIEAPAIVHNAALLQPTPGAGIVTIKRDTGGYLLHRLCFHPVYLDGAPLVDLLGGQGATVYVPPGRHILGLRMVGGCGNSTPELAFEIHAGERQAYRTAIEQTNDVSLKPTAF